MNNKLVIPGPDSKDCYSDRRRETLQSTWRSLELLLEEGICRAIGVSNFQIEDLEMIMEDASIVPHVNQCEFHPCQNPEQLRTFCRENKIQARLHLLSGMSKRLSLEFPIMFSIRINVFLPQQFKDVLLEGHI